MAKFMHAYSWVERRDICPSIVTVTEVKGEYPPTCKRILIPFWTIEYEFATYGRYRIHSARMPWQPRLPNILHIYPPRVPIWEDTRNESGLRHSAWIFFSGGSKVGLNKLIHSRFKYTRIHDTSGEFGEMFKQAAKIGVNRGEEGFWEAQSLLCRALQLILGTRHVEGATFTVEGGDTITPKQSLVRELEQFLNAHLGDKLHLQTVADHLHVSKSKLSHTCKLQTGEGPMAMLIRLRIRHAKSLLMKGLSLKDIARQLGFSDAFHLSKTFKKLEGVSPRDFLKALG